MNNASWYVVTIIIKCEVDDQASVEDEWTCIQSVHLIRAASRDEAYEKAICLGKEHETIYKNSDGQDVVWKFVGLENIEDLSRKTIARDLEVWGRVIHTSDPSALTVDKEHLDIYYNDQIRNLTAEEILSSGTESKLVCNRVWVEGD